MNRRKLTFIGACFYYSGLVKLVTWWTQLSGQHLIILNYHFASLGDLRSHVLYLRRHYRILHLDAALEELTAQRKGQERTRDRRTPLVLTFDDGYRDNYTHAFALAQELQVPITIFLIPYYIESGNYFWWLKGRLLVQQAQVDKASIDERTYHLYEQEEREALAHAIYTRMLFTSSVAEREAFLASVSAALKAPASPVSEDEASLPLTWTQVLEMARNEYVSFGAHTIHHPVLSYLADPDEIRREVRECRTVLEQKLGYPVNSFAYPLGKLEHIGDAGVCAVQEAGYAWALTTVPGLNTAKCNPYLLRRIPIDITQHWTVTAAETCGVWGFFSRLLDSFNAKASSKSVHKKSTGI